MENKTIDYLILGSGIGGLAAGAELKSKGIESFLIIDKSEKLPLNLHNGVHYLHDINFEPPFPFDFKKITLTEEIWNPIRREFKKQSLFSDSIQYSIKTLSIGHPSSIMSIGKTEEVYVPESNNMNDLLEAYYKYIGEDKFKFGYSLKEIDLENGLITFENGETISDFHYLISTLPLDFFTKACNSHFDAKFDYQPIFVTNYEVKNIVPNWMINLYIPELKFPAYRISVLNNTMSIESCKELAFIDEMEMSHYLREYFEYDIQSKQSYNWKTGKIISISKDDRGEIIDYFENYDIFLIGRFGLWNRKLLMHNTAFQSKKVVEYLCNGGTGTDIFKLQVKPHLIG